MNIFRTLVICLFVFVFACSLIWAGGKQETPTKEAEKVELLMWQDGEIYPYQKAVYEMIEKEMPHISLEVQPFLGELAYGEYATKIAIALASGKGPDTFEFFDPHIYWMISTGMVASAPDEIQAYIKKEALNDAIYEAGLDLDGKMYGVPWAGVDCDWYGTYYNKKMFKEAGITKPPSNWEEFIDAARKLTLYDSTGKITRSGFSMRVSRAKAGIVHKWIPFFSAAGGKQVNQERTKTLYDSEAGIEATQLYVDLLTKYKVDAVDIPRDWRAFAEGKTAMFQRGMWVIERYANVAPDLDYGVFPIPNHKETGKGVLHIDTQFVAQNSKHKKESWEVIKFLTSSEVTLEIAKIRRYLPLFKTAAKDPAFGKDELLQVFAAQQSVVTPKLKSMFEIQEAVGGYIERAAFGKMGVREALKAANAKATEILKEKG